MDWDLIRTYVDEMHFTDEFSKSFATKVQELHVPFILTWEKSRQVVVGQIWGGTLSFYVDKIIYV